MKILVTGAKGFVGRNLVVELNNRGYDEVGTIDVDSAPDQLVELTRDCGFVFHLAGVNRPEHMVDYNLNQSFTEELLKFVADHHPEIYREIAEKKIISPELEPRIHDAIKEFTGEFRASLAG